MSSYLLMIDKNDVEMSWARFPNDLWLIILHGFLAKQANRIALDGISKIEDLPSSEQFSELKQKHIHDCELRWKWAIPSGKLMITNYSLALFQYDKLVQAQFEKVKFSWWNVTSNDYPYEEFFFFRGEELILRADSLESTLKFPKLSTNQISLLKELDPRIAPNLHTFRQDEITLSCIEPD
jgi:hypothetical protein